MSKSKKAKGITEILKEYWYVFFIIFILWVAFFISVIAISQELEFSIKPSMSIENMGVLGDSFNIMTSLFTGLAFAGVIVTILLQKTELTETRVEFKKQADALELQQIDNKFFQMLNELNSLINRLDLGGKGHATFDRLNLIQDTTYGVKENFNENFKTFNDKYDATFKYYFINLYQIINYIDKNVIPYPDATPREKEDAKKLAKEYINIIRAQQTKAQIKLLFFNGIGVIDFCGDNGDRYKKLIEKYALFEHIRYLDLLSEEQNNKIINYSAIYKIKNIHNDANKLEAEYYSYETNSQKSYTHRLIDSLLIQYEKEAFGKNSNLIEIWENRRELLSESSVGEQVI